MVDNDNNRGGDFDERLETHRKGGACDFLSSATEYSGPISNFLSPLIGTQLYLCSSPGKDIKEC